MASWWSLVRAHRGETASLLGHDDDDRAMLNVVSAAEASDQPPRLDTRAPSSAHSEASGSGRGRPTPANAATPPAPTPASGRLSPNGSSAVPEIVVAGGSTLLQLKPGMVAARGSEDDGDDDGFGNAAREQQPILPTCSGAHSSGSSASGDVCLICLESLDLDAAECGGVTKLGCHCTGPAAYRHRDCILQWVRHKGNTTCEVCKSEMTGVVLPPPPAYAIFTDLENTPRAQLGGFWRLLVTDGTQCFGAALVFCIIFDVPLRAELLFGCAVFLFIALRCLFMITVNYLAHRRVFFILPPADMG